MSDNEYTPTMKQIEDGYAHDPESEYRDPVNYGSTVAANRRAFRRALEAHDREVTAEVLREAADEYPGTVSVVQFRYWLRARAAALGAPVSPESEGKK